MNEPGGASPLVGLLKRSVRVVAVQPWMVEELGLAGLWFAQCLWRMQDEDSDTITAADDSWLIETGLNRAQVHRARTKVIERGWITCRLRRVEGAPTTVITLSTVGLETYLRANHCTKSDSEPPREIARSSTSLEVENKEEKDSDRALPGFDAPPVAAAVPSFDEFWKACPKKVGRGEAERAWARAVKRATPEQIIAGMRRYAGEVVGVEPRFVKTPGPWLNGDRWLDEPGQNRHGRARQPVVNHHGPAGAVAAGEL